MRTVVRAVIIRDGSLVAIKRVKNSEAYWVLPGGGVEDGESHEEALVRECKEELGLDVAVEKLFCEYVFKNETLGVQQEYFYRCTVVGGTLGTGDGPEYDQDEEGLRVYGSYEPMALPLGGIADFDVRPHEVRDKLA